MATALLVAIAFILFVLLYFLEEWPSPRRYKMMSAIHGPKGIFYFGNGFQIANQSPEGLVKWLMDRMAEYPRMMKLWLLGGSHVYLQNPEDVQVLFSSNQHIKKGYEYTNMIDWLNEGLLLSTGKKWQTRRKMLTPAFHFRILEDSITGFNKHCKILCEKLENSKAQPVNVDSVLTLCTLDVICETAMGIELDSQNNKGQEYVSNIKRMGQLVLRRGTKLWLFKPWIFVFTPTGRNFKKVLNYLHNFTTQVIQERRKTFTLSEDKIEDDKPKVRRAFLDSLLEFETKFPNSLSTEDIREEVDTFMFEGHDTTSAALNFYFFNMGAHPSIQEKVYSELQEIFGDDTDRPITMKDLQKMTYLEKTVKESLRMFPSVPYISRLLETDLELDGVTIPAPSNIVVMPYKIHRNEQHWPDPENFDPDRFCEDEVQKRHPYAYIPFSAGPRNCIGQKFAMMELKMVAASVLRKFRVQEVTKRKDFDLQIFLVLRTSKPIYCKFIPR